MRLSLDVEGRMAHFIIAMWVLYHKEEELSSAAQKNGRQPRVAITAESAPVGIINNTFESVKRYFDFGSTPKIAMKAHHPSDDDNKFEIVGVISLSFAGNNREGVRRRRPCLLLGEKVASEG